MGWHADQGFCVLGVVTPGPPLAYPRPLPLPLRGEQGPPAIVRSVRQALGGNLARALTIARTELLRAYREASRRTYAENRDVVEGWVWHAALGTRTCAFCWAMHGSVHRLSERMATHPNCRCAEVPLTRPWAALGFRGMPETRASVERGAEVFVRLPEAEQLAILGPAKLAAYRAGALKLDDLAGFRTARRWGRVGYERSLADIVGAQEARRWLERGPGLGSRPMPIAGGAETPREQVQRWLDEGRLTKEQLVQAEQVWQDRLRHGVTMPNGETVRITLDDVYHALGDDRIRRRPERIEQVLLGVFELRTARGERRMALSRWTEQDREIFGYAIIDPDSRLRTLHVVSARSLEPYRRREQVLWPETS